jgi:hypothetical protein
MFRLITLIISVGCLAAFVWFGLTVDLGERTLFGHLLAISKSDETQQLWQGTKSKVNDVIGLEAAKKALAEKAGAATGAGDKGDGKGAPKDQGKGDKAVAGGPPQDDLTKDDREAMRRLIGSAQAQNKPK